MRKNNMFGIYIHIPFCHQRCPFCDFTLTTNAPSKLMDDYIGAVCKEIEQKASSTTLTSIYLGGGTPSILSISHLNFLLDALKKNFDWGNDLEITLEANPEDISVPRAQSWKQLGINRISLGVQSMDNQQLKRLGRNHNENQVFEAFQLLREAKFHNISVDLMFGLENQTLQSWKNSLLKTIQLQPTHISTYNLTIEKNTKYNQEFLAGTLSLPSDDLQSEMMMEKNLILEKYSFVPYEISNASIAQFESRHNMLYWTGKPYLGFGVSAHSFEKMSRDANNPCAFDKYHRYWNTKNIPTYIQKIESGKSAIDSEEILDHHTHLTERLMTGLRLKNGVDLKNLESEGLVLPEKMKTQLSHLVENGFLMRENSMISIPTQHTPITNEILLRLL